MNKLAKEKDLPLAAAATAFGSHHDLIKGMDLVILAPQMDTMKDELKKECDQNGAQMITTTGKQYIQMTQHADQCLQLIISDLNQGDVQ